MDSHRLYMQWLRAVTRDSDTKTIETRTYKNAAQADELITLPSDYWRYVDWLEGRGDIDFQHWVLHCEAHPHPDTTISNLLIYWLWKDQCNRWLYNHPVDTNTPPEGFRVWKVRYGSLNWQAGYGGRVGVYQ